MEEKCMGVTHFEFDFDGGSCMRFLQIHKKIQGCIFGDDELKKSIDEGGIDELIFVDASPKEKEPIDNIGVKIYDHHKSNDSEGDRCEASDDKTAFDIMLESVGICNEDPAKIEKWRKLVKLGDQKSEPDDMDITRALKRVHALLENDNETYEKWFVPLFDSFFANEPNFDCAIKVLQNSISEYISNNPNSPARPFMQKWMERMRNKEKIQRSTLRNLVHFMAYMDEDTASEWSNLLLEGYHKEQTVFQECKRDFTKAKVNFYDDTLVISAITPNPKFVQVARYMIFSQKEDVVPLIKENIKDRNSLWTVLLVNPKNKNFQIFINGNKDRSQVIICELIKAIRAELLLKRSAPVPSRDVLSDGGIIESTEPLYFHKLETGYPSILWGSLKHPSKIQATEFGNTSAEIHSRLVEIIKLALDKDEYASGCNPSNCQDCSIYLWQLQKCEDKRKSYAS